MHVAKQADTWDKEVERFTAQHRGFLNGSGPIVCARAPGRLDVMGGVIDYSGGTVLEMPLAPAACAAVQASPEPALQMRSTGAAAYGLAEEARLPLDALARNGVPVTFAELAERLRADPPSRWTALVAGGLYTLIAAGHLPVSRLGGLNVAVESHVPLGAGVSSSAAIEVAVMTALAAHYGLPLAGSEIATLCQITENRVAGAPCGIMDQMTSALGREDNLLVLKCQPATVVGHQAVPPGWRLVGIDSGVRHSVGGQQYESARIGAFMALAMLQAMSHDSWGGYLCNVPPDVWPTWRTRLPETITGAEFAARYRRYPDPATHVRAAGTYAVRASAEHGIMDNNRVREFLALLHFAGPEPDPQLMSEVGGVMYESHESASHGIGLGAPETDLLVNLVKEKGPAEGLYGARMSGGGAGGTVAVLCDADADPALHAVMEEYQRRSGHAPRLVAGTSPGAHPFGIRRFEA